MAKTIYNVSVNGVVKQFTDASEAMAAMTEENNRLAALVTAGNGSKAPVPVSIDYRGQANVYLQGQRFPVMTLDREKFNAIRSNIAGIIATVASVEDKLAANWEKMPKALPKGTDKPAATPVPFVSPE
jgi:hypothetical protein